MANLTAIATLKRLSKENPKILLLYGEETMLMDEVVNKYLRINDIKEKNDFNFTKASSESINDELKNIINMPPMFASSRVLLISDFDKIWNNSQLREAWNDSVKSLLDSTKLILIDNGKPNKRVKVYKNIAKIGYIVECSLMSTSELLQWIKREFKRKAKEIDRDAMEYLISQVGLSMHELRGEIDKLIAFCANKTAITKQDITEVVVPSIEAGIFACVDALGQRDIETAYKHLQLLHTNGEPPLRILAMFIRQIRLIMRTKLLQQQDLSTFYIMKELGIPEFVVKKLYRQTDNFTVNELKELMLSLNVLEDKIKTGKLEPKLGLETWLLYSTPSV